MKNKTKQNKTETIMNKPAYLEVSILELSKILSSMIKRKYGEKVKK